MAERVSASISRSLAPLRDVVASLSQASAGSQPSPNDRRRLVRRVRAAGSSALPALLRALTSTHEGEARWAAWLLLRVGPAERPRVAERVSRMLEDPRLGPAERARAVSLLDGLVDVGLEVPEAIEALGEHAEDIHALCEQIDQMGSLDGLDALAPRDGVELIPLDELPEPCQRTPAALLRSASRQPELPSLPGMDEREPADAAGDEITGHGTGEITSDDDALSRRRRIERRPRRDPRETGFSLLERGDLRGARRALREAVEQSPDDGESRSYLGVCLLQLGEAEEALTHLEHAVSLCPDEALHHWNVASAAKATGRMCRAWLALGRHLQMGDEFEGAAARRREARERSPNLRAAMLIAAVVAAAALRPAEVSGNPAVVRFEVAFVDRATGPSAFPLAVRPSRVGTFGAQTKSGAGYFYDEVLEYRVWLHPERGAEPLAGTFDYFAAFARYETAAEYARTHAGSEHPIVLVLQREHIKCAHRGK